MTLGAMKQFKTSANLDLWGLLLTFIDIQSKTKELPLVERMRKLYEICDYEIASFAIHALIEDQSIPLEEVQDGMFRVGWLPTLREGDWSEPWPLVLVFAAIEVDKQLSEIEPKKKADISEQ